MTHERKTLPSPFEPDVDCDGWPDPVDGSGAAAGTPQADELYKAKLAHIATLRADETAEKTAGIAIEKAFLDSVPRLALLARGQDTSGVERYRRMRLS
jgi:hypothetical protein